MVEQEEPVAGTNRSCCDKCAAVGEGCQGRSRAIPRATRAGAKPRDLAAARKAYEDSLDIAKTLAGRDPGTTDWQRDCFISLVRIDLVRDPERAVAQALATQREALAIVTRLAEASPTNAVLKSDLAYSSARIAELEAKLP